MKAKRNAAADREATDNEEIAAPAILRVDYVRNRSLTPEAGAPMGWRRQSPLEAAFERGQLGGGNPQFDALRRFEAGEAYARLYALSQASGRDSTDLDRIGGAGRGDSMPEAQARALHSLAEIDRRMNARDRMIVRMVCGEGHFPSEAVRTACNDYRHTVASRFREALDALIEAMLSVRRAKKTAVRRA